MFALASLSLIASVQQLSVCQGGACMRGGSKAFTDVVRALAPGDEDVLRIINCGCLGPCPRGVAVRVLGGSGKGTFTLQPCGDSDFLPTLEQAADVLSENFGLDVAAAKEALLAKHSGDMELASGDFREAMARYGEAIESQLGTHLLAEARNAERPDVEQLPNFGLTRGLAAEREAERLRPPRVRWLFEALCRRCEARLSTHDPEEAEAALSDAEAATVLCRLANDGWHRMWDAADAIGDEEAASTATAELSRLGYSLEQEGEQDAAAKPAVKLDYWGRPMA